MSNIHFYPRLTDELLTSAGTIISPYEFFYESSEGEVLPLVLHEGHPNRVEDPADIWQLREDGISLDKSIVVEYPDALKGPAGILPKGARLLPCILWTNACSSTAGVIFPTELTESPRLSCRFVHKFEAGTFQGDLTLEVVLYVGEGAVSIIPGEEHLMNESGVILGNVELPFVIDFDGKQMEFPIEEYEDAGGPLWRMHFEPWEDPREDAFDDSSFVLLLNTKHPNCPRITRGKVSNQPLLEEILCEVYYLLIDKIRDFDDEAVWEDMITDSNLTPESICSVLHWFSQRGEDAFDWSSPEGRMLSIKKIVDQNFLDGDNDG